MRQGEDTLTRDMLASTASAVNCVGGGNGDSPTNISATDIDALVANLMGNDAYSIADNIEGENKFGTAPVRDCFLALTHTALTADLQGVAGFIQKNQYPSPMNAMRSEWGAVGSLRFLLSSIGSISANASNLGNDVYNIFCVGMESYACVELDNNSAQFIFRPALYSDALAQNVSIGYKYAEVPKHSGDYKFSLIDLEALMNLFMGDRAQA